MHAYGTCKASDVDAVTFIDLYRADRLWLFMKVVATYHNTTQLLKIVPMDMYMSQYTT